jgi:alpha,alpha-trehalose phosphorylase
MNGHTFTIEPWALRETSLDLDELPQTESLFALANGHIGLRANLDEGEPFGISGTYLNSFYELRPLPHAEAAYGDPEAGQTLVNATDGKIIRLLVNDEPFDVRYGELRAHERVLDLRAGTLTRRAEWRSPAGTTVRVRSTRLVSFLQRSVAAILYEVEAVDEPLRVVIQSELVANEPCSSTVEDPRTAAILEAPLRAERSSQHGARIILLHSTKRSGLRVAAGIDHLVDGPGDTDTWAESGDDTGRFTIATELAPGEAVHVVKFVAYAWSSRRSFSALHDEVVAALAEARHTGWDGLAAAQRRYLAAFWDDADVEIDGDTELQQAIRFSLFHTLQAAARAEGRAIAAKGLSGPGYDGHTFWDTERFVVPVLTFTCPRAAADALRWRHATIDLARTRARQLGLDGAAFPWRTIRGQECSGYWPASTAAFHVNGAIADGAARYVAATGDDAFERETGLELLIETARLWRSLGHHDPQGNFRLDGVTGPDEYSAIVDNNLYTNLVAQKNLNDAADAVARHPRHAARLGADYEEAAAWRAAAQAVVIPWDDQLGVHPQSEGFTQHEQWDFTRTSPDQYPLLLHFPYYDLYRKQVIKQADLVLALYVRGDAFTDEQKARDFAYYETLTVRDSSLSAGSQAILAAETGHLQLALDYFAEAALIDLRDLEHNTRDGLHIASLANAWLAAVAGFGGLRDTGPSLSFAPRLPAELERLCFRVIYRGRKLHVEATPDKATYTLREGEPLTITHYNETVMLTPGSPVVRELPPVIAPPRTLAPLGRAPTRHGRASSHRPVPATL